MDAVSQGDFRQFNVGDVEVLVINIKGQIFCLAARCTHAGAPLAEGQLNGDMLICPWHGSQFRIYDGAVLEGPAEKALKVYASKVQGSYLFVNV